MWENLKPGTAAAATGHYGSAATCRLILAKKGSSGLFWAAKLFCGPLHLGDAQTQEQTRHYIDIRRLTFLQCTHRKKKKKPARREAPQDVRREGTPPLPPVYGSAELERKGQVGRRARGLAGAGAQCSAPWRPTASGNNRPECQSLGRGPPVQGRLLPAGRVPTLKPSASQPFTQLMPCLVRLPSAHSNCESLVTLVAANLRGMPVQARGGIHCVGREPLQNSFGLRRAPSHVHTPMRAEASFGATLQPSAGCNGTHVMHKRSSFGSPGPAAVRHQSMSLAMSMTCSWRHQPAVRAVRIDTIRGNARHGEPGAGSPYKKMLTIRVLCPQDARIRRRLCRNAFTVSVSRHARFAQLLRDFRAWQNGTPPRA